MLHPQEFVSTLFPRGTVSETPCLTQVTDRGWMQYRVSQINDWGTLSKHPWYVCVSTVKEPGKDDAGHLRTVTRRAEDCLNTHVLFLDDIGTKSKTPEVDPSCILESSRGNYQYIYRINPYPVGDGYFDGCIDWFVGQNLTDKGAKGVNRLFRVPGSLHKTGWNCKVVSWKPERVWDLPDLMAEFGAKRVSAKPPKSYDHPPVSKEELEAIEDPVLDWLEENGSWDGSMPAPGQDWVAVRCPWAKDHSNRDVTARYSPLGEGRNPLMRGFKCFHGHCEDKNIRSFLAWLADKGGPQVSVSDVTEFTEDELGELSEIMSGEEKDAVAKCSLPILYPENLPHAELSSEGKALKAQLATTDNVEYVARKYGIKFKWNVMTKEMEAFFRNDKMNYLGIDPQMNIRYVLDGCQLVGIRNLGEVRHVAGDLSTRSKYHPMEDWVKSVKWDGQSRFQDLLDTVICSEGNKNMLALYLRKWLIQGVQAVCGWRNPKMIGSVLVFSGPQYLGKTTWFKKLVKDEFFTESVQLDLKWKKTDSVVAATQTPISELGELEVTFRKSEAGALKGFLTDTRDVYRPAYGRHTLRLPRATSFCASVNRHDFLIDETGHRRYWPISVKSLKLNHDIDAQQLWAEVHTWWKRGETWYLSNEEMRRHEIHAGEYAVSDETVEAFHAYQDKFGGLPYDDWKVFTVSELAKMLDLRTDRGTLATLRYQIEKAYGPRKGRIKGSNKRNCWELPDPATLMSESIDVPD